MYVYIYVCVCVRTHKIVIRFENCSECSLLTFHTGQCRKLRRTFRSNVLPPSLFALITSPLTVTLTIHEVSSELLCQTQNTAV